MGGIVDSAHSDHCWLNGIDRGTFLVAMETDLGGRATSPALAGTSGGNQRGLGLAAQVGDELVTAVAKPRSPSRVSGPTRNLCLAENYR
ncbi:hypothetical protein B2J88_51455 [Rhodococcus sp. SRB_17]|nr:hypothetical protein [Rhodococcus sp. SRB_17]